MLKGTHHSDEALAKMRGSRPHRRRDPLERFNEKVDVNGPTIRPELGPCHVWTGKRRSGQFPYGQFFYRGRWVDAHRWIFEQRHGPLPEGFCALHKCDLPQCVRGDHLWQGTRRDNCLDMVQKGRHRPGRGERQRDAKLSYAEADTIRFSHSVGGVGIKTLARWYAVSESTIGRIIHNQTWILPKAA